MKFLLCLIFALLMPKFCWGEDVSLVDSPDWTPMNAKQRDFVMKNTHDSRGRESHFVDGGVDRTDGGVASIVAGPHDVPLTKAVYDAEVKEFLNDSLLPPNVTLVDQQTENVASLPGISALFRIKHEHSEEYILGYTLLTERESYLVLLQGSGCG